MLREKPKWRQWKLQFRQSLPPSFSIAIRSLGGSEERHTTVCGAASKPAATLQVDRVTWDDAQTEFTRSVSQCCERICPRFVRASSTPMLAALAIVSSDVHNHIEFCHLTPAVVDPSSRSTLCVHASQTNINCLIPSRILSGDVLRLLHRSPPQGGSVSSGAVASPNGFAQAPTPV